MTNKKPFLNWMLHGIELPLHQNLIYCLSLTAALEQSLRAIWDAASQAAVLILPQIKLNSQLSSCTSFLVDRLEVFCLTYRNFHFYLIRYFSVFSLLTLLSLQNLTELLINSIINFYFCVIFWFYIYIFTAAYSLRWNYRFFFSKLLYPSSWIRFHL